MDVLGVNSHVEFSNEAWNTGPMPAAYRALAGDTWRDPGDRAARQRPSPPAPPEAVYRSTDNGLFLQVGPDRVEARDVTLAFDGGTGAGALPRRRADLGILCGAL